MPMQTMQTDIEYPTELASVVYCLAATADSIPGAFPHRPCVGGSLPERYELATRFDSAVAVRQQATEASSVGENRCAAVRR
jgi:hypothetical protein